MYYHSVDGTVTLSEIQSLKLASFLFATFWDPTGQLRVTGSQVIVGVAHVGAAESR